MTIREALNSMSGEKVYIGTQSSFIVIGECNEKLIEQIDAESDAYFMAAQRAVSDIKRKLDACKQQIDMIKLQLERAKQKERVQLKLDAAIELKGRLDMQYERMFIKLDQWVDLLDREVRTIYRRDVCGPGWVVLAEGEEIGTLWNENDIKKSSYLFKDIIYGGALCV